MTPQAARASAATLMDSAKTELGKEGCVGVTMGEGRQEWSALNTRPNAPEPDSPTQRYILSSVAEPRYVLRKDHAEGIGRTRLVLCDFSERDLELVLSMVSIVSRGR